MQLVDLELSTLAVRVIFVAVIRLTNKRTAPVAGKKINETPCGQNNHGMPSRQP